MSGYLYPNGLATPPTVTNPYNGRDHFGDDSINHPGRRNRAICSGVVVFAGYNPSGAGNEVAIVDDNGHRNRQLHFATGGIIVERGQRVVLGQDLGEQGSTGDSTGIHDHTEVWIDNLISGRTAPWPFIAARLSATAGGGTTPITGDEPMQAMRNYDTSIGLINPDGTLDPLTGPEWEALKRLNIMPPYIQQDDGTVWNALTARTARIRSQEGVDLDEAALARAIAPLVVGPIVTALAEKIGRQLTEDELEGVVDAAIRGVFADAAGIK